MLHLFSQNSSDENSDVLTHCGKLSVFISKYFVRLCAYALLRTHEQPKFCKMHKNANAFAQLPLLSLSALNAKVNNYLKFEEGPTGHFVSHLWSENLPLVKSICIANLSTTMTRLN